MAALRAFRRAKGLCVRCAERWSRDHTCPDKVQLHAIQEVWDVLQSDDSEDQQTVLSEPQQQLFLAVSAAAFSGEEAPKTMQFKG